MWFIVAVQVGGFVSVNEFFSMQAPQYMISMFVMQILSDKDPSVMSAALCALIDLVASDVKGFKNLTASFVSILKQVAEHRLPKAYDYHRTPAPFIQVLNMHGTVFEKRGCVLR